MSEQQFRVPWITDLDGAMPCPTKVAGEFVLGASLENFDIGEKVDGYTESELVDLIDVLQKALEHMETTRIDESQLRLFP